MKLIKFDLPINGTKIRSLEELRETLTTEILALHASGVLSKWLKSRNLDSEVAQLAAIPSNLGEVDRLVSLCEILGVDSNRAVIEAALSDGKDCRGVSLYADPEELKYKEKYERLSSLMEDLKSKKLYLTQEDYNRFVKDKIQIEQEGKIDSVCFCEAVYELNRGSSSYISSYMDMISQSSFEFIFKPLIQLGEVVEVGEVIGEIMFAGAGWSAGCIKSPIRGVLLNMGEITQIPAHYRADAPICYIRIDHDTAPTIKIIAE